MTNAPTPDASGWLPISCAPRDGTQFLAFDPARTEINVMRVKYGWNSFYSVPGDWRRQPTREEPTPDALPLVHDDAVERVAVAIEHTMFAPSDFPLDRKLHIKYRWTARAAIAAMRGEGKR